MFFSSLHGTFSRIDYILGHKTSLSKFKRIEIISRIFSDHLVMKLEINHRKKNERKKKKDYVGNKQYATNQQVNDKIKEEIRKHLEIKKH